MLRILPLWDPVYPPPPPDFGAMFGMLIGALLLVAVLVGLFVLCRALVLWYWRVNELVVELKMIRGELRQIRRGDKDEPPTVWGS